MTGKSDPGVLKGVVKNLSEHPEIYEESNRASKELALSWLHVSHAIEHFEKLGQSMSNAFSSETESALAASLHLEMIGGLKTVRLALDWWFRSFTGKWMRDYFEGVRIEVSYTVEESEKNVESNDPG